MLVWKPTVINFTFQNTQFVNILAARDIYKNFI